MWIQIQEVVYFFIDLHKSGIDISRLDKCTPYVSVS
jgi:hypothetical protein